MLVAITGASGFIGTQTVKALHKAGHRVRALVRQTSKRDHLEPYVGEWRRGAIDDPQTAAGLVAGADAVIHEAVDREAIKRSPISHFRANVLGTLQLLEACRQAHVPQFIFISSAAAYHEILPDRKLDESHPTWPANIYGAGKAAIEPFLKAYHVEYGMNTSAWRPAAVYGVDHKLEKSQWYDLIKTARDGGHIHNDKGGKITHVQDVADAVTLALGDEQVAGKLFNLVERYMYWQQAAEFAKELSGSAAQIDDCKGNGPKNTYQTDAAVAFFNRHGNQVGLRRGLDGVRDYVRDLLPLIPK